MISIIIPYIRPAQTKILIQQIKDSVQTPIQYEILAEEDKERIGCPKMVKKLVARSKYDNVIFIGDDTIPKNDFIKYALYDLQKLPDGWGLVGLNDLTGRTLATHWLASKKLLPLLNGEFFHTGYTHCFCDVELMERCKEMGRYIYSEKAIVIHNHPIFTKEIMDADYKRIYSKPIHSQDRKLFIHRRKNQWKTLSQIK